MCQSVPFLHKKYIILQKEILHGKKQIPCLNTNKPSPKE